MKTELDLVFISTGLYVLVFNSGMFQDQCMSVPHSPLCPCIRKFVADRHNVLAGLIFYFGSWGKRNMLPLLKECY